MDTTEIQRIIRDYYQAGFRKGRGPRDQIANIGWIMEKAREFQKNIHFCFTDYAKAFDYVDCNKLENSSRDGNTRSPDLPLDVCKSGSNSRNWTQNNRWFQIGKGIQQGCILSPFLFNLYAEYIMQNARLNEAHSQSYAFSHSHIQM